jgi:hypothetical protein
LNNKKAGLLTFSSDLEEIHMKKIAALIAMTVVASAANAAPVAVAGNLNTWKSFNAASKAPVPYSVAKAGFDLVQATVVGANIAGFPSWAPFSVNVAGSIDSVTGYGTLTQVGTATGYYDVNSDNVTDDFATSVSSTSPAGGGVSFTGLTWTLDATGMHQTAGIASGCDSGAAQCSFTVTGVNANDHSNGLNQSIFDFQGITAGFQTLPLSNAAQTTYGKIAKTWAATPGLAGSWSGFGYSAQLASRVNSGSVTTNAANVATLSLNGCVEWESDPHLCEYNPPEPPPSTIPVPAAAWLMGSGLLGLTGIARRKKSRL